MGTGSTPEASVYIEKIDHIDQELRTILLGGKPVSSRRLKLLIKREVELWNVVLDLEGASD